MSDLPKPGEDVQQWLEERHRAREPLFRRTILETGHPDAEKILAEYDRAMRDNRLGLTSARNCWHSISPAQARVLAIMGAGCELHQSRLRPLMYDAVGRWNIPDVCSLRTARPLCAHELAHVDGGAFDPERRIIITERGLFVLRHGY